MNDVESAFLRGWFAAADAVERPYGETVFRPLTDEQVRAVVAAMNVAVPNASERMHAQWARHWAGVLRETGIEGGL